MKHELKSFIGFTLGFPAFYLLAWLLGTDVFGISLTRSWTILGDDATGVKVLMVVAPLLSMFVAGSIGGAVAALDPDMRLGSLKPVKFFGSFFVAFVVACSIAFRVGCSILVGAERFDGWQKTVGAGRFMLLYHFLAPAFALIGGVILTTIFAGRPNQEGIASEERNVRQWYE